MNLSKSYEFFKPESACRIHIVGCGSVGSTIAENLARCGVTKMTLYDFDKVESHNIVNQMFRQSDVGRLKVEALRDLILEINPDAKKDLVIKPNGWKDELMSGIIVLAVDNIELRKQIVRSHWGSTFVMAMFDVRTGLTFGQTYAADWGNPRDKKQFLESMNFSHDEAAAETPVSACGVTLGVVTTVRLVSALCVNNIISYLKGEPIKRFAQIEGFGMILDAF